MHFLTLSDFYAKTDDFTLFKCASMYTEKVGYLQ